MSYNSYLSPNDIETSSPNQFSKNSLKVGYGNPSKKDQEIQMLEEKYGLGRKSKKNLFNFQEIKKVPEEVSNLRQTLNSNSYSKLTKPNLDDMNIKQSFKRSTVTKPENSLRHTVYQRKLQNQDNDFYHTSSNYSNQYPNYRQRKEPQDNKYSYKIHEPKEKNDDNQKSKIDYDKINEKLRNNAMMIEELRRLKDERKNKKMQKQTNKLSTNNYQSDLRYNSSKSTQISNSNTPKVSKNTAENNFRKSTAYEKYKYQSPILQKSSNQYHTAEKSKYQSPKLQKFTTQYTPTEKPKYQSSYLQKSKYETLGLEKSKIESPIVQKPKSNTSVTKQVLKPIGEINNFILVKPLGEGKFGQVFLSYHKLTKGIFALKKVPKKMIKDHFLIDQFILELKIQSYFSHKKILSIYGYFDDKESIYLILEYMEEGTLFSYLKKNKTLNQEETAKKVRDVAQAVYALHQQGVAHRDIKPQNIVMSCGVGKLCDFGWSTICNQRRKTYCGTFDYAAPQILEGAQYDMSVDTWCIGILAYELMVGKAPFYHISRKQTMKKILNVDNHSVNYPETMSKNAVSFIENLIIKNPQQRMKTDEMLKHKFLDLQQKNKFLDQQQIKVLL